MKILFVDMLYDYGLKSRGFNVLALDGVKKTFERLGHVVEPFYYDEYFKNTKKLQTDLKAKADEYNPDLIYFCLFRKQFEYETLDYLKSKYVTLNWFGDDQWRFDTFTKLYAPHFTWCVTTDKFALDKYRKIGQHNVIYSQWAAVNEHQIPNLSEDYKYQVSFVGQYHPYRKWFLNKLKKEYGIEVNVFGHRWKNNSPISNKDMNQIFANTKINLNISNSTTLDSSISYLLSSPRAIPQTIISGKTKSQMKARNFEIPYFGGFQLTNYVPTIEDYFIIGKEIVCYTDVAEAALLIKYYLEHDDEREKIKNTGHLRTVYEHGYIHRFKKIFEIIR